MSTTDSAASAGHDTAVIGPDFEQLLAAAREVAERAYAPYSRFRVGAAALTADGRLVRGCNVENAGYGVTLCAECGLISELVAGGGGELARFVCVGGDEHLGRDEREVVMPCGRCRQLLSEHAADDLVVLTPEGPLAMDAVLPQAFGPADLRP
ncbi:cytidine deaminase [Brachybacterium sacelli]|uniref:Cytidine deaminase n=1 Tax=Brachybacterium sacelli TaxID=173364 RepID=A0ABS4X6Z5_9MICO|nr:cytidine deaminase [Brachybacterium sacelli]MBP2383499.1 cytidine deaminase [Brachybacterium sacelli]